jgi:hypothetical protein
MDSETAYGDCSRGCTRVIRLLVATSQTFHNPIEASQHVFEPSPVMRKLECFSETLAPPFATSSKQRLPAPRLRNTQPAVFQSSNT